MRLLLQCNIASHYRASIYQLIDQEFECDYCFGDKVGDIKKMDYSLLKGEVTEVHNVFGTKVEYQKGVVRLLSKKYDTYIVYAGIRCISAWLFLIARKVFYPKKRVYAWTHGMLGKEGPITRQLYKLMFRLVTGAFIYNERSRNLMIDCGVPSEKLFTVYNSLDYDKQLQLRESLHISSIYYRHFGNNNKNIVFIGRLTAIKRLDLLLEAVSGLRGRGEIFNVTFIGDGVERANLKRIAEVLGIHTQVWFYGASYDETINAELIYNADLCVSPGNIGLTAIHVLMFGCPAITNNDFNHQMPEFEAIEDGKSGAFFEAGDSSSLANSISEWFAHHKDDREDVRKSCYKVIDEKWNPHHQIEIIKDVLEAV